MKKVLTEYIYIYNSQCENFKEDQKMLVFLYALAVILMIGGGIFLNKLRVQYYGIIGVGGSYLGLLGIAMLAELIAVLFGQSEATATNIIVGIIFMLVGIGYLVFVMLTRCETVMQRVFLPIVAVMIAFGFCWRFLLSLIFRIPVGSGEPENIESESSGYSFPYTVYDEKGETWERTYSDGEKAEYRCAKTGECRSFRYDGEFSPFPNDWRAY